MSKARNGPQSGSNPGKHALPMWPASPKAERADAARNRAEILRAAKRLFARQGVGNVSMDAVAAEAGVGKGTLFRRFRDKAGLAEALLDEQEKVLQQAIISGPAPLGPGRGNRLKAFFEAYLDYALDNLELVQMSETSTAGSRYRVGAYRFWHQHVSILLSGKASDPEAVSHMLLAMVSAEHLAAMKESLGVKRTRAAILSVISR